MQSMGTRQIQHSIHFKRARAHVPRAFQTGIFFPLLVALLTLSGTRALAITLTTITIDGDMSDWVSVLADPDNSSTDPQGTSAPSTDRDYLVQSIGRDLLGFGFTWDANALYLYVRRLGAVNSQNNVFFYVDVDDDGLLESTERVIQVRWWGNKRDYELEVRTYVPASPGGDPIVDGNGLADGYTPPGTLGAVTFTDTAIGGTTAGDEIEVGMAWAQLGPLAGSLGLHVSTSNSTNLPSQVDDNMGGAGGGGLSIVYARLEIGPDHAVNAAPGATLLFAHDVTNVGTLPVLGDIWTTWSCAGAPAVTIYEDVNANATLDVGIDTPLGDSDGDGRVDHSFALGETLPILVEAILPTGLAGTCVLEVLVAPDGVANSEESATNTITFVGPALTLVKSADRGAAAPGDFITYTTAFANAGVDPALQVVLEDRVPPNTSYVMGSAAGAGTTLTFSHDDGLSFDTTEAPPVTHVRWTLLAPLASGAGGSVSFQVQVD
jgi:uncharacterized repeat protein (TIGR01451 family)